VLTGQVLTKVNNKQPVIDMLSTLFLATLRHLVFLPLPTSGQAGDTAEQLRRKLRQFGF